MSDKFQRPGSLGRGFSGTWLPQTKEGGVAGVVERFDIATSMCVTAQESQNRYINTVPVLCRVG